MRPIIVSLQSATASSTSRYITFFCMGGPYECIVILQTKKWMFVTTAIESHHVSNVHIHFFLQIMLDLCFVCIQNEI